MIARPHLLVRLSGLVPTLIVALLSLYRPPFLANLEYSVYDVLVNASHLRPPDNRVVIVDVDFVSCIGCAGSQVQFTVRFQLPASFLKRS